MKVFVYFTILNDGLVIMKKSEEIIDKQGKRAFVKRKDILRAYFLHIIDAMKNRFKCQVHEVHISSPVKQKYLFQKMFADILPEYAIEKRRYA